MRSRQKLFEDVPDATRRIMRSIRGSETKPEIRVRKLLHAMGYRFRLHSKHLPGTPDIVLPKHKAVIFVHGCFWHQHPGCKHAKLPRKRQEYWLPKLARTQARDEAAESALANLGWRSLVTWECATEEALVAELTLFLGARDKER